MKKLVLRATICLFISIFSLNMPNIGGFKAPKATIEAYASTHSLKKVKRLK